MYPTEFSNARFWWSYLYFTKLVQFFCVNLRPHWEKRPRNGVCTFCWMSFRFCVLFQITYLIYLYSFECFLIAIEDINVILNFKNPFLGPAKFRSYSWQSWHVWKVSLIGATVHRSLPVCYRVTDCQTFCIIVELKLSFIHSFANIVLSTALVWKITGSNPGRDMKIWRSDEF